MNLPRVTVIALCYNHEKWVQESILSVLNQSYQNIELIVVDDASKDFSNEKIKDLQSQHHFEFIRNSDNLGNCKAFNRALKIAKGKYVIDFATDDLMPTERIARQVDFFESLPENVGVIYSNTKHINENGDFVKLHFEKSHFKPQGHVFEWLLSRYFIDPSSQMIRKSLLDSLGGYNEALAYEDFDFWMRSSQICEYKYQDEVLAIKRDVPNSLSKQIYTKKRFEMNQSTYLVCESLFANCKSKESKQALFQRINYEIRVAFRFKDFHVVLDYFSLLQKINMVFLEHRIYAFIAKFFV